MLAAQGDINGNTRVTQASSASASKPTANQRDVTTQMGWEPNYTSQVPKTQENCESQEIRENAGKEDENKTTEMGFRNEAAQQTAAPESKAVEMSVEGN